MTTVRTVSTDRPIICASILPKRKQDLFEFQSLSPIYFSKHSSGTIFEDKGSLGGKLRVLLEYTTFVVLYIQRLPFRPLKECSPSIDSVPFQMETFTYSIAYSYTRWKFHRY